ncbi:MAG: ABC transporter permease [Candidatus Bathyarchaeia archaeon]|jgi:ABC-type Na+ efflux pump permease subunit
MRLWKSWIVTSKDLSVFKKNKYILYSLVSLPLIVGVVLPLIFIYALGAQASSLTQAQFINAANTFANIGSTYFVLIPVILPSIMGSYSIVGEKIEKSLEPLLATPTTDGELLLGKSLATFLPTIGVTYIGAAIFITIMDVWSYIKFGLFLLPNADLALILGLMAPLACILSVEANIIISSRVNDIRAAQQLGTLVVLPLILLLVFSVQITTIPISLLALIVSAVLAVADIALFSLSKATFQREEILTKWK